MRTFFGWETKQESTEDRVTGGEIRQPKLFLSSQRPWKGTEPPAAIGSEAAASWGESVRVFVMKNVQFQYVNLFKFAPSFLIIFYFLRI